jgi:hypothetical protein
MTSRWPSCVKVRGGAIPNHNPVYRLGLGRPPCNSFATHGAPKVPASIASKAFGRSFVAAPFLFGLLSGGTPVNLRAMKSPIILINRGIITC